jgi:hypothetical protein
VVTAHLDQSPIEISYLLDTLTLKPCVELIGSSHPSLLGQLDPEL